MATVTQADEIESGADEFFLMSPKRVADRAIFGMEAAGSIRPEVGGQLVLPATGEGTVAGWRVAAPPNNLIIADNRGSAPGAAATGSARSLRCIPQALHGLLFFFASEISHLDSTDGGQGGTRTPEVHYGRVVYSHVQ